MLGDRVEIDRRLGLFEVDLDGEMKVDALGFLVAPHLGGDGKLRRAGYCFAVHGILTG
jgi:hypothetical protein